MQVPVEYPYPPSQKVQLQEYHFVQDLRAISEIVHGLHPVVLNPYTLLTAILEEYSWFSVWT